MTRRLYMLMKDGCVCGGCWGGVEGDEGTRGDEMGGAFVV